MEEWLLASPATRVPMILTALGLLIVLPLTAFAVYMWRMAGRVTVERTFPPSGYRVVGKRPAITGDAAIGYARFARLLAVFMLVMALLLAFQLWRLAALLTPR